MEYAAIEIESDKFGVQHWVMHHVKYHWNYKVEGEMITYLLNRQEAINASQMTGDERLKSIHLYSMNKTNS